MERKSFLNTSVKGMALAGESARVERWWPGAAYEDRVKAIARCHIMTQTIKSS